jgi:mono/diheme cytochrome c family protein
MKQPLAPLTTFALAITTAQAIAQETVFTYPIMPDAVDIVQGEALYTETCAACHGVDMEGQPNWRSAGPDGILPAPPHDDTGHTWHHSDAALFNYTALGGEEVMAQMGLAFNSGMPGFADSLSPQEIWNILAYIQSTWPDRIQVIQAVRTEADLSAQGDN